MREGLIANQISRIYGIINGTSNFILSEMSAKGASFGDVLKEAQLAGFAEADPTLDLNGEDVAHKLIVLTRLGFGINVTLNQFSVEGISAVTAEDIEAAHSLGFCIKQLAIAELINQQLALRVHPALIPLSHALSHINGVINAVMIEGHANGTTVYQGAGAGGLPTASAIIADLSDLIQHYFLNSSKHFLSITKAINPALKILPLAELTTAYYLRLKLRDEAGALAQVTQILANENISIESLLQKQVSPHAYVPVIIKTHPVQEALMQRAITALLAETKRIKEVLCLRIVN